MSEVTIVCCYNNEKIYNELLASLKIQTCPYELIGIDNRGNKSFSSCASAYNSVINQVKTKYVIYSHQDIIFTEPEALAKFVKHLDKIENHDILGVSGVRFNTPGIMHIDFDDTNDNLVECDTVDELLFAGYTKHFAEFQFDEVSCDGWHLYAVEACLQTKSNYVWGGGHVYICKTYLIHTGKGAKNPVNFSFVSGFCKICRKYANAFPFIRTTCAKSKTDYFHLSLYVFRRFLIAIIQYIGIYHWLKKKLKRE